MQELLIASITISVCSVVWIRYLLDPDGLFSFFPSWLECILNALKFPNHHQERIEWVLTECEKCFAGQVAFWTYLIMGLSGYNYLLVQHIVLVAFSIFGAALINAMMDNIE